ncbi:hypothetical protein E1176_07500, partial [Fulvivirga sp. RKSG066]|uniref:delta-60 repeat domain-containing protein n=1 Tax=Fulvivirga aurantia TaxID=2529383 RepID=UPI0012BBDCFE
MNLRTLTLCLLLFTIGGLQAQTVDPTFNSPTPLKSADVEKILTLSDGKLLIIGQIDQYEDVPVNGVIKLNTDGTLDESFTFSPDSLYIRHAEERSNGNIVLAGWGTLVEITATGEVVYITEEIKSISRIKLQPNDQLLISTYYSETPEGYLLRLNSDNSLDETFTNATQFNSTIYDIEITTDKIVLAGSFSEVNSTVKNDIVKLNFDGTLDTSFDTGDGTDDNIGDITLQADGKILLGDTYLNTFNGTFTNGTARLNVDGSLDTSFNPPFEISGSVSKLVLQGDKILLYSSLYFDETNNGDFLWRMNADGSEDLSFNRVEYCEAYTAEIAVLSDGVLLNEDICNGSKYGLTKTDADGNINLSFNPEIYREGGFLSGKLHENKLYVTGDFIKVNEHPTNDFAVVNLDGSVDTGFSIAEDFGRPSHFQILDNGQIMYSVGNEFFKLNNDGSVDPSFSWAPFGELYYISYFEVLDNGKIIAYNANNLYRLNADGTEDPTYQNGSGTGGANSSAYGIGFQSSGKLVIGSAFDSYDGTPVNRMMRLNEDGSLDDTFDLGTGPNEDITDILILSNDEIIVLGYFDVFDGQTTNGVVRIDADGGFQNSYDSLSQFNYLLSEYDNGFLTTRFSNGVRSLEKYNFDGSIDTEFLLDSVSWVNDIVLESDSSKEMYLLGSVANNGSYLDGIIKVKVTDRPVITGLVQPLSTMEETPLSISLSDLTVEDSDSSYPDDFTLTIQKG